MRPRLTYSNVVATMCLVAVVGGTAIAATTKPKTSKITACVVKKGKTAGALRIVAATKKCKKTEKKISWNQKGAPGAAGGLGAAGPAGAAGVAGAAGATGPAGKAGADAIAPAGAVMFFALPGCPAGWSAYAPAQG